MMIFYIVQCKVRHNILDEYQMITVPVITLREMFIGCICDISINRCD